MINLIFQSFALAMQDCSSNVFVSALTNLILQGSSEGTSTTSFGSYSIGSYHQDLFSDIQLPFHSTFYPISPRTSPRPTKKLVLFPHGLYTAQGGYVPLSHHFTKLYTWNYSVTEGSVQYPIQWQPDSHCGL